MCEAGEGRGDEVRERSPLHELGDRDQLGFFDNEISDRDKFRTRVHRNGSSAVAKGPLVGRHPLKANFGNIAPNVRVAGHAGQKEKTRYGTASSETSPLSSRKNSATNGQEKSPISNRRQSSNIQAPQRPSRLPVVSMYNPKQSLTTTLDIKQIRPQINPTSSRKVTPPCQDHDQIQMSPLPQPTSICVVTVCHQQQLWWSSEVCRQQFLDQRDQRHHQELPLSELLHRREVTSPEGYHLPYLRQERDHLV